MLERSSIFSCLALLALVAGCSSSSGGATNPVDGGSHGDAGVGKDAGLTGPDAKSGGSDAKAGGHDGGATTTIAAARMGNVTTPITVKAFVTALAGVPTDYPIWYIEDPAGGPYSGVAVYCDPKVTKACNVTEPALHDLIEISGSLSAYKGELELEPTAMTVLQSNATFPPIEMLKPSDIAPSGTSPYRGVFVSLSLTSKLTVDSVTPSALADTACGAVFPADGGTTDAGPPACTNVCEPPLYSGFQVNDGAGNEVYIEAPFFHTDPLQSSPECLTQSGVVPVTVGMTFSAMSGVLDFNPYASAQELSPVLPANYATP